MSYKFEIGDIIALQTDSAEAEVLSAKSGSYRLQWLVSGNKSSYGKHTVESVFKLIAPATKMDKNNPNYQFKQTKRGD